nr:JHL25P11.1 [Jatropha curcas]
MYKNPGSRDRFPLSNPKPTPSPPLLSPICHDFHLNPSPQPPPPTMFSPLRQIMVASASWLRTRRSRCLFLILCSPILLPFLCAIFPLLCAVELCIRICRRGQRMKEGEDEEERLRRCEEGYCNCDRLVGEGKEVGLLQRYLEDQLLLVGSMYECGDEFYSQNEQDYNTTESQDFNTPLLG